MISSSLRTGCPLPQITPCPLIDRFTLKYHGLNVIHKDDEEDYGLPRTLTLDILKDEQYLSVSNVVCFCQCSNDTWISSMFCVGLSTAFGIVNRLDRLMMAVKEVVGEQYHIHGIGVPHPKSRSQVMPAVSMNVFHSGSRDDVKENAVWAWLLYFWYSIPSFSMQWVCGAQRLQQEWSGLFFSGYL